MKISEIIECGYQADRLIKLLDSLPPDEVFLSAEIETKLNFSMSSGAVFRARNNKLKDYWIQTCVNGRAKQVWGNKKAIAALRRQLDAS